MSTNNKMKSIVLAVGNKHAKLVSKLQRDRDWLWLQGDYKELPTVRETLKDLGFRFSRKGHELEGGEVCHWYHSCGVKSSAKRSSSRMQPPTVVNSVSEVEPEQSAEPKDLYVSDADAEYAAMFA